MSSRERDPWSVAAETHVARISARVEKRLDELERRQRTAVLPPGFVRAADRMANLRPVRVGLTLALRRGLRSYTTIVTVGGVSIPVAFTESGWFTQEMVDAKIARVAAESVP